jgi:hypothetical protein
MPSIGSQMLEVSEAVRQEEVEGSHKEVASSGHMGPSNP